MNPGLHDPDFAPQASSYLVDLDYGTDHDRLSFLNCFKNFIKYFYFMSIKHKNSIKKATSSN